MCPPNEPRKKRKPPFSRSRATNENWALMDWLNERRQARGLSMRAVAEAMGYVNASRVSEYLNHKIVPGPDIVRRLALAIGVSPIEALWLGGHYEAVFGYFNKLYRLGWAWMHEDHVHLNSDSGACFFLEHWSPDVPDDLSGVPPKYAHRYHDASVYNLVHRFRSVPLPIPMACAFLLAIGLFNRRGDVLRPTTRELIRALSVIAAKIVPTAEFAKTPDDVQYAWPFKEAQRVLPRRFPDRGTRLAIVSEYVQSWCDVICSGYAQYARVALYEQGGFVGEPERNNYWVEDLWEWQVADPVILDEFRSHLSDAGLIH
jgi:hypothetical protein